VIDVIRNAASARSCGKQAVSTTIMMAADEAQSETIAETKIPTR
jgi:hypothetical protein